MSAKKRKRDVPVLFGFPMRRWKRSSRKWHSSEQKPERLSAEDGCGRLCGTAGLAGAEGTGIPVAPKQQ